MILKMKGLKSYMDNEEKKKEKKQQSWSEHSLYYSGLIFTFGVVQFKGYLIEQLWMSE